MHKREVSDDVFLGSVRCFGRLESAEPHTSHQASSVRQLGSRAHLRHLNGDFLRCISGKLSSARAMVAATEGCVCVVCWKTADILCLKRCNAALY